MKFLETLLVKPRLCFTWFLLNMSLFVAFNNKSVYVVCAEVDGVQVKYSVLKVVLER